MKKYDTCRSFACALIIAGALLLGGCTGNTTEKAAESSGAAQAAETSAAETSAAEEKTTQAAAEETSAEKKAADGVVTPADGYDTAGYVEIEVTKSGTMTFVPNQASLDADIEWEVYVFKKQFDDAFRYIGQSQDALAHAEISAGGSAEVKKGQYVYINCSENAFTGIDPTDGAEMAYVIE